MMLRGDRSQKKQALSLLQSITQPNKQAKDYQQQLAGLLNTKPMRYELLIVILNSKYSLGSVRLLPLTSA